MTNDAPAGTAFAAPAHPFHRRPPEGWKELAIGGEFTMRNGPLYLKEDGDSVVMGFRVEAKHCNPMDVCHGGMLATFADMLLPVAARSIAEIRGKFLPTISLSMTFLAPAKLGGWVEGRTRVLRVTRNLVFCDALITSDGVTAARCDGVFKIGQVYKEPGLDITKG